MQRFLDFFCLRPAGEPAGPADERGPPRRKGQVGFVIQQERRGGLKQRLKRFPRVMAVFLLLAAALAAGPRTVLAAFSGSYKTGDAYDALQVGDTLEFSYLQGTGGYMEEKQQIWAVREDGTLADSWEERILGSTEGVPYFCIEQNAEYVAQRTAEVFDGLDYLSQEEITRLALALKYLEDHMDQMDGSRSDLYYLQQLAVWKIRDEAGYNAYGEPLDYGAARLESQEPGEASVAFSVEMVRQAIAWADANRSRYKGYCKILDSGQFQKCAVFKAEEIPGRFVLPETGSAGTLAVTAAGGMLLFASVIMGRVKKRGDTDDDE